MLPLTTSPQTYAPVPTLPPNSSLDLTPLPVSHLQLSYETVQPELQVGIYLRRAGHLRMDSADGLHGEALRLLGCWVAGFLRADR